MSGAQVQVTFQFITGFRHVTVLPPSCTVRLSSRDCQSLRHLTTILQGSAPTRQELQGPYLGSAIA